MRQRAMIAMALTCRPSLLIADEPTTALDVTTEAQILDLMRDLQAEMGMAIMYITHNLGVVAEMCDEVVVMYLGKVVEQATWTPSFTIPSTPTPGAAQVDPQVTSASQGSGWSPSRAWCPTRTAVSRAARSGPAAPTLCRASATRRSPTMWRWKADHHVRCHLYR